MLLWARLIVAISDKLTKEDPSSLTGFHAEDNIDGCLPDSHSPTPCSFWERLLLSTEGERHYIPAFQAPLPHETQLASGS